MISKRDIAGLLLILPVLAAAPSPLAAEDPVAMEKEMAALRQEVAEALMRVPRMTGPFDHLAFTISGSVVTLQGFAAGPTIKQDAQRMVERLDWVTRVENEIEFYPSEPQVDGIRERVLAILVDVMPDAFSERYPDLRIQVDAEFNVTIVGMLAPVNRTRLESALVRVEQLALVKSVTNEVLFKTGR